MARSDLLVALVRAGATGNRGLFRKAAEAVIAEERAKRHDVLADRLASELLSHLDSANGTSAPTIRAQDWLLELTPQRRLDDLVLEEEVAHVVKEVVEEQQRADLLRSHNLIPRNRLLFVGPPGNGKTSLAEAIAAELMVPLLVVRYESVIGSYLGETAARLGRLFDAIRTRPCVLFFDEFDTLGKERGDTHETGEIKRVVSSLLTQVDALPSHVCLVTATNHDELLDRAVWRRFQVRLKLNKPTRKRATELLSKLGERVGFDLGMSPRTLADRLRGLSCAELEEFVLDVARRRVLALPSDDVAKVTKTRLAQWQSKVAPPAPERRDGEADGRTTDTGSS